MFTHRHTHIHTLTHTQSHTFSSVSVGKFQKRNLKMSPVEQWMFVVLRFYGTVRYYVGDVGFWTLLMQDLTV